MPSPMDRGSPLKIRLQFRVRGLIPRYCKRWDSGTWGMAPALTSGSPSNHRAPCGSHLAAGFPASQVGRALVRSAFTVTRHPSPVTRHGVRIDKRHALQAWNITPETLETGA